MLKKHKYSAFIGTALDGMLRSNGIKTIIVTGIATNVCVESTVRDGFMMDYHVVVPSDLVYGVNEEYKAWSLKNIGRYFGHVLDSAEILEAWARRTWSPWGRNDHQPWVRSSLPAVHDPGGRRRRTGWPSSWSGRPAGARG